MADYFEETLTALYKLTQGGDTRAQAKAVSNFVMTEVLRVLNERSLEMATFPVAPDRLAGLVYLRLDDKLSSSGAQEVFAAMFEDDRSAEAIAEAHNLLQVSDAGALVPVVDKVIQDNPKQLGQYLSGKESVIGYFIGQVMRTFDGSPDPKLVRELLKEKLEAQRN